MKVVFVAGPSMSGKTTLVRELTQRNRNIMQRVASFTTRKMRKGEIDGVDYHFSTIEDMIANKDSFLEQTEVLGNLYGVRTQDIYNVVDSGKIAIRELDVIGCQKAIAAGVECKTIYLYVSEEDLIKRSNGNRDLLESMARKELEDSIGLGFDLVLERENLESSIAKCEEFILNN